MAETPCQKCKRELVQWRAKFSAPHIVERELAELRRLADARFVEIGGLRARVAELEAVLAKRHACVNCGPCPCTDPD